MTCKKELANPTKQAIIAFEIEVVRGKFLNGIIFIHGILKSITKIRYQMAHVKETIFMGVKLMFVSTKININAINKN
jgi:hypothetical protein